MKEAILKKAVADYLETGRTMGKWTYDRLQAGRLLASYNGGQRMINLCRNGTSDFFVFRKEAHNFTGCPRLIFIELKTDKTKQNADQVLFEAEVKKHGAEYYVVRSLEELERILPI